MGSRLLRDKLLNPVFDINYLNEEYNLTEYVLNNYKQFLHIRKKLWELKDIERLERKIILKKIQPVEVFQIYKNVEVLNNTLRVLSAIST